MTWYSVSVTARGEDPAAVTDDAIDTMVDLVQPHSGVVGGGHGYDSWDATVTVDSLDAQTAQSEGVALILALATEAGLPAWPVVRAEVISEDELDRELATPNYPDLVSGPEAGEILGVSRQRVHQLAAEHPHFPQPLYKLAVGSLWVRAGIEAFAADWERKPGRPRKEAS